MLSDEFISLSETYINVCVDLVKSDRFLKKTEIAKSYFADAKFCLRF